MEDKINSYLNKLVSINKVAPFVKYEKEFEKSKKLSITKKEKDVFNTLSKKEKEYLESKVVNALDKEHNPTIFYPLIKEIYRLILKGYEVTKRDLIFSRYEFQIYQANAIKISTKILDLYKKTSDFDDELIKDIKKMFSCVKDEKNGYTWMVLFSNNTSAEKFVKYFDLFGDKKQSLGRFYTSLYLAKNNLWNGDVSIKEYYRLINECSSQQKKLSKKYPWLESESPRWIWKD